MKSNQGLLVGQLITSAVAALFLFVDDFSGYYYNAAGVEVWGYVYLGSGFLSSLLVLIAAIGFLGSAFFAYKMINGAKNLEKKALSAVSISLIVTILGAVIFAAANIYNETQWWFGGGFYGAFAGGLLSLIFIKLGSKK